MNNEYRKNEKNYSYEQLRYMMEHSKKYNFETDKKLFLKNIHPIEQKMILLSSNNPYEVLSYLDELNLEFTNIMLKELKDEEIIKILSLFSAEDKKSFYATFSNPYIVNRFIEHDNKAFTHIPSLELERKIELLDNSNMKTVEATQKVYESISKDEQKEVIENLNTADGMIALSSVGDYDSSDATVDEIIDNNQDVIEPLVIEEFLETEESMEQNETTEVEKVETKNDENVVQNPKDEINASTIVDQTQVLADFEDKKNACEKLFVEQIKMSIQQAPIQDTASKTI